MISATLPEPVCDVVAQLRALLDPRHPKDTVWLARGTVAPDAIGGIERVAVADGVLFTASREKARHFRQYPTDETLAEALGYIVPKRYISPPVAVVRAVDGEGRVITEMVCAVADAERALMALYGHGMAEITTVAAALMRRVRLL
jgi:hypothetical protein